MSNSKLHDAMFEDCERYLRTQLACTVILTEPAPRFAGEQPDLIGWERNGTCHVVDVKVSRRDAAAHLKKPHVANPAGGMGDRRWLAVPESLQDNLPTPDGWGLLGFDGEGLTMLREASVMEGDRTMRERLLLWHIQKEAFSGRTQIRTKRGHDHAMHKLRERAESEPAWHAEVRVLLAEWGITSPGMLKKSIEQLRDMAPKEMRRALGSVSGITQTSDCQWKLAESEAA